VEAEIKYELMLRSLSPLNVKGNCKDWVKWLHFTYEESSDGKHEPVDGKIADHAKGK